MQIRIAILVVLLEVNTSKSFFAFDFNDDFVSDFAKHLGTDSIQYIIDGWVEIDEMVPTEVDG